MEVVEKLFLETLLVFDSLVTRFLDFRHSLNTSHRFQRWRILGWSRMNKYCVDWFLRLWKSYWGWTPLSEASFGYCYLLADFQEIRSAELMQLVVSMDSKRHFFSYLSKKVALGSWMVPNPSCPRRQPATNHSQPSWSLPFRLLVRSLLRHVHPLCRRTWHIRMRLQVCLTGSRL